MTISWSFLTSWVHAEPSLLVSKLMETPVTMFELGIIKVDRQLERNDSTSDYRISYLWQENKFLVSKVIFKREGCKDALTCINSVKQELRADTEFLCWTSAESESKCDLYNIMSGFGRTQFQTANFYKGKDSSEAASELKYITDIKLIRFFNYQEKTLKIECLKRLTDDDIKCSNKNF